RRSAIVQLHELVQLSGCDETAVQHTAEQWIIPYLTQRDHAFPIPHGIHSCYTGASTSRATHGRRASGSRTNRPNSVCIQPCAGINSMASCWSPHSLNEMSQVPADRQSVLPIVSLPTNWARTTTRKPSGFSGAFRRRLKRSLFCPCQTHGSAHSNTRPIICEGRFGLNPPHPLNRA